VTLTAADVAEIMRLVEQSGFDELTLEIDGIKLNLKRGAPAETSFDAAPPARAAATAESSVAPSTAKASPAAAKAPTVVDPDVHEVASPLLGTFYRASKPGAPPFVEVGTQVEEETVVAIIEVMKLMNTVRAGVRGTVTEILVGDGALVEYDETLVRVRKAG
jgi:acetyl-CoA carboxylase biotin carboxyl carrier protein